MGTNRLSTPAIVNGKEIFELLRGDLSAIEREFGRDTVSGVEAITEIGEYLRSAMSRTLFAKLGYLLARNAFAALKDKMDPRKVNGGVFLGLNGVVIKSHGGTDAEGFAAAVDLGYDMARY